MTKTPNGLYADSGTVLGDILPGSKLAVASAEVSCPVIVWTKETSPPGSQGERK